MNIEATPEDVITKTADRRGRVTIGSEYAGEELSLVVATNEKQVVVVVEDHD